MNTENTENTEMIKETKETKETKEPKKYKVLRDDPVYRLWLGIKKKCTDSPNMYFKEQETGMSDKWLDFNEFKKDVPCFYVNCFFARKDTSKGFTPENTHWTTKKPGNKCYKYFITYKGVKQNLKYWAKETGLPYDVLRWRKKNHFWSDEETIETPLGGKRTGNYSDYILSDD